MKDMTKKEFTEACFEQCAGLIKMAAWAALAVPAVQEKCALFVEHLLEQDGDDGSRSGTRRVLGEDLYNELQKFKNEKK